MSYINDVTITDHGDPRFCKCGRSSKGVRPGGVASSVGDAHAREDGSFTRTHDGLVRRGDPSLMPMHQRPNRVRDCGSRTRFRKYIRRRPPRRRRDGPQDRRARGRVDSLLTCALRHPNAAGPTVVTGKPQPEQQHGGDPRPDQCCGSIIKIAIAFL